MNTFELFIFEVNPIPEILKGLISEKGKFLGILSRSQTLFILFRENSNSSLIAHIWFTVEYEGTIVMTSSQRLSMDCLKDRTICFNENVNFDIENFDSDESFLIEMHLCHIENLQQVSWAKFKLPVAELATEKFFQGFLTALDRSSGETNKSQDVSKDEIYLKYLVTLGAKPSSKSQILFMMAFFENF